jgi:hypothetical protein
MIHFRWYESGGLFGIHYRFECSGEHLPTHAHERETLHNIIVLRGSVQVGNEIVRVGSIHDFDGSVLHTVAALEPQTEILNCFLWGKPADYETLPESEKAGVL